MELVLGIDLGTSYFKLGLFDRAGNLCGIGRVLVEKDTGDGNRCELPVGRFWSLLRRGLTLACEQAQARPEDIKAIAYSSQANSFVLLGEDNQPLTDLILWPDSRAEELDIRVQNLWQRNDFVEKTGLGLDCSAQYCLSKLCWFQKHQPDMWASVNRIMTISDYLTFALTGDTAGDMGTASLLGLWDIQKQKWWQQALQSLGLSGELFSTPLNAGTVVGGTNLDSQKLLGLKAGIPFAIGSIDHHVAAIGAGIGRIADFSESTGTVLACLNYSKKYDPRLGCCIGSGLNNDYYQLAFNDNGAAALEWYQKQHAPNLSLDELLKMAESIEVGSDGLIARARCNQYEGFKGFENISSLHRHGHFIRAITESVALDLAKLVDSLCLNNRPKRIVATGGGAQSELWLKIKADLLGTTFITTNYQEPACAGAAMFAAVAAKWFRSIDDVASVWISVSKSFSPRRQHTLAYDKWRKYYTQTISTRPRLPGAGV